MRQFVRITEVAARDGLQNEPAIIPAPKKAEFLRALALTGADEIEATSFVSPKWIPQLGDAEEVLRLSAEDLVGCQVSVLVPNEQGMRRLIEVNAASKERIGRPVVAKASVFASASEGFSKRNTNTGIAECIERFKPVAAMAKEHGLRTRGYISCVIRCPFDGDIQPEQVARVARMLVDIGIEEIDLGDTIGAAEPRHLAPLIDAVVAAVGPIPLPDATWEGCGTRALTLHLHDTFGRARECVTAAIESGVRSFDGSVAGIGGCPYASIPGRRAPGNIATQTLVDAVEAAGFATRIDRRALEAAGEFAGAMLGQGQGGAT
ncbi:MAG: hydroxymethylglutaryl-CoA lyase [Phycisphaerales bacterium]